MSALEWGQSYGARIATASVGYYIWYDFTYYDGYTTKTTLAVNTATEEFDMMVITSVGNLGARGLAPPSGILNFVFSLQKMLSMLLVLVPWMIHLLCLLSHQEGQLSTNELNQVCCFFLCN